MISFQTNNGASAALQMLSGVQQDLSATQTKVATGKDVNGAKDNAALWAIAEMQKADIGSNEALQDNLALNEATVNVAAVGAEFVSDTLRDMKKLAITASSGGVDFSKIEADLAHKTDQINSVISGAQFNGANLLKTDVAGAGSNSLTVSTSINRDSSGTSALSSFEVASVDFEGSADFDIDNRTAITDEASAKTALAEIEGFLKYATDGAASLGSAAARIEGQQETLSKQTDAIKQGTSALIDANIEEAATQLAAGQVQQQLATTSLSIANAAPQALQGLF